MALPPRPSPFLPTEEGSVEASKEASGPFEAAGPRAPLEGDGDRPMAAADGTAEETRAPPWAPESPEPQPPEPPRAEEASKEAFEASGPFEAL